MKRYEKLAEEYLSSNAIPVLGTDRYRYYFRQAYKAGFLAAREEAVKDIESLLAMAERFGNNLMVGTIQQCAANLTHLGEEEVSE